MRKRNVQILFRLTEEEAEQLYSLVKKIRLFKRSVPERNGKRLSALRKA